jgi:hypothetical protein
LNLEESLLEKSKLAQRAYEEGHKVGWDEDRLLEIGSNSRYRKYKESAHMACLINPISQPTLDLSTIWIIHTLNELASHRKYQYNLTDSSWASTGF